MVTHTIGLHVSVVSIIFKKLWLSTYLLILLGGYINVILIVLERMYWCLKMTSYASSIPASALVSVIYRFHFFADGSLVHGPFNVIMVNL